MLSLLSSDKLTIYLATYHRGVGKPDHWGILVATSETAEDGQIFQIIHGRPFFEYRSDDHLPPSSTLKKCPAIGKVKARKIDTIAKALGEIRVVNDDENWNCQNWTREAIAMLEGLGCVAKGTAADIDAILARATDRRRD